ncbi:hypothetical protein GGR50DRAFT_700655 [Xylaria sp. CBS 124048]|nr:hypothetical protein GGR50DRAFT_700655 [Xylaria sp. CBS 124048]
MRVLATVQDNGHLAKVFDRLSRHYWIDHVGIDDLEIYTVILEMILGPGEIEHVMPSPSPPSTPPSYSAPTGKTKAFSGLNPLGHAMQFLDCWVWTLELARLRGLRGVRQKKLLMQIHGEQMKPK